MRVLADFSARWTTCWVTTYTFEPAFFDTVMARRLGDPPLNVVVLADQDRLARTWRDIGPGERWSIRGANRSYLIRGVSLPAGVFHPKTILLANDREGVLLVGSGNVGFDGLDRGNEVYSRFHSANPDDLAAFGAWREWMNEIVAFVDEPMLRMRWGALLGPLRWLPADATGSRFIANWRRPILEQFVDAPGSSTEELHYAAPFFDADLAALSALVNATHPDKIVGYFGEPTSVNGRKLVATLEAVGQLHEEFLVNPPAFIHAKLFALIDRDEATVLSGSANASAPALLRTALTGNAEAGVISRMDAMSARALFVPPDRSLEALGLDDLHRLEFDATRDDPLPRIRLVAATLGHDRRITVTARPASGPALLTDGERRLALTDGVTVEQLDETVPDLVWLEDASGEHLSNAVPLDIRADLDAALRPHDPGPDRPRDLDALDIQHPLGRLLAGLHRGALFDIDDTPAARHAQPGESDDGEVDDTLWERLLGDELDADPRAAGYHRRFASHVFADDELTWLLEEMLHRAPSPTVLRLIDRTEVDQASVEGQGHPWTAEQKLALRAYNVLARWSMALTDRRVEWFGATAQVRHYAALLGVIAEIWPKGWIKQERLRTVLGILFGAFIRGERSIGYLAGLGDAERAAAVATLGGTAAPEVGAAVAFAALRDAGTEAFFAWQAFLVPGRAWGVFRTSPAAAALASSLVGATITEDTLETRLDYVSAYTDDDHWCARIAGELGVESVSIGKVVHPVYGIEVSAVGLANLRSDPRAVSLVRSALAYRQGSGVRLRDGGSLITVAYGRPIFALIAGRTFSSIGSTDDQLLETLVADGAGFGSVLEEEAAAS